ncbi:uncharacterized protein PHALS_15471 [Plasmopara halstedii]|uniref:Uncharacterized protein n=1 Tax=Plasmopara halstedii TaxID=4781 RepID=A0A0P1AJ77_PLAHL|nr:uncharacterized protein PHALS_15471 [Plasmopara halstedii]CEG40804.1 hypothetical protein PHALS_15471 [Plasmopara halstedii]|eukprot:XP_024577173.1 hypothetical protein PHALS_15471 [Plasmopara halstedii]
MCEVVVGYCYTNSSSLDNFRSARCDVCASSDKACAIETSLGITCSSELNIDEKLVAVRFLTGFCITDFSDRKSFHSVLSNIRPEYNFLNQRLFFTQKWEYPTIDSTNRSVNSFEKANS